MPHKVIRHDPYALDKVVAAFATKADAEMFVKAKYASRWGFAVLSGVTYSIRSPKEKTV